jgi:hypothetical protein
MKQKWNSVILQCQKGKTTKTIPTKATHISPNRSDNKFNDIRILTHSEKACHIHFLFYCRLCSNCDQDRIGHIIRNQILDITIINCNIIGVVICWLCGKVNTIPDWLDVSNLCFDFNNYGESYPTEQIEARYFLRHDQNQAWKLL